MRYPYYRFTCHFLNRKGRDLSDLEAAKRWLAHFRSKGVPACLTCRKHSNKGNMYDVWVWGDEHVSEDTAPNSERLKGTIIDECCGFSALLEERRGS